MPTSILLATRNQGKAREFQEMLGKEWIVLTTKDVPEIPEVLEDGQTFEANARKKALAYGEVFPGLVLADDSGLEVDALNGAPGIYSARFAGEPSDDRKNNQLLLSQMAKVPEKERGARFVCVLALSRGSEVLGCFQGTLPGKIVRETRGNRGFGYDPMFVPDGYSQTLAELDAKVKNGISHRSQALKQLLQSTPFR
jgi:XTP/dITP diphosphohydrolase